MKISLVTPSFNQVQFIEETINSVLSQNYENLEYIIIDGGSTDGTIDIIKKYDRYLTYWTSEKDSGQSEAINKGLKHVTGDVFNWLCSDDLLEPGALDVISNVFDDKSVNVVTGKIRMFGEGIEERIGKGTPLFRSLEETIVRSYCVQPVTFFKTEFIKKVGINPLLHYFMDKEIWLKYLFLNGVNGIKQVDDVLASYRLHPESKTTLEMDPEMISPKSKFKIDNNSIYYSLANQTQRTNQLMLIESLSDTLVENYIFSLPASVPSKLIKRVVHTYLYFESVKQFYNGSKNKSYQLLKNINALLLPRYLVKDYMYLLRKSLLN
ncbi:glycosyltransferase family 2 protein [Chondrinema litorale]|uniref:glycosyltransferase family 2 protein n=1 Tax=Chondrinema litorale TaxID=2994555 RepID=UPI002543EA40|nr:glycosyltransferase family 2 protein [Chondrinema litorale]UZR92535.1 glycosyltransferase family 2 protein [Chondrinema litorale]